MPRHFALVAAAIVVSALAVVYERQLSREAFVRLQALQAERDDLNVEWSKLLLEQGAFSTHPRIEKDARERLDMDVPGADRFVVVRMPAENGS